jgi:hypothetical protein
MVATLGVMLYLSILFTGEEYHIDYVEEAEQTYYNEIQEVKNDEEKMNHVEEFYIPQVDDLVIYKYDDEGEVVIIDPREKR